MTKKLFWILVIVLAVLVGIYPSIYFLIDRKFGLLSTKTDQVLNNVIWNISFYIHIILGGIALLIGWTQFNTKRRSKNLKRHRQIGKVYIMCVLLSSIFGLYIACYATGGILSSLGFISLDIIWFYSTVKAYLFVRQKQVVQHQKMMIYSYAACFAAVTLRIWLPLLMLMFGDFEKAYIIVAWLSWVPNIIVAYFIIAKLDLKNWG